MKVEDGRSKCLFRMRDGKARLKRKQSLRRILNNQNTW
ncbi:hypothetical protein M123_1366 [Bacteroides fragilis str. 3976T8]|uniref:Uncharacterized protein n=1 Tax=Bacteroides fragilis str. 3976T8 TaxID=1339314 RepID=A0A016AY79_BACFG|nr:hypothetical protein M071_1133 [Bacteroides fragilis str. Ds-233]EXZ74043.1 hypothetical protein M123_1366 [Bacteroides fragilis str. 3976T8]